MELITAFDIYLISICDTLSVACIWFIVLSGILAVASFIAYGVFRESANHFTLEANRTMANKSYRKSFRFGVVFVVMFCVLILVNAMLPTKNTLIAMYAIPKIVNSEYIQNNTIRATDALVGALEKWANGLFEKEFDERKKSEE